MQGSVLVQRNHAFIGTRLDHWKRTCLKLGACYYTKDVAQVNRDA